MKEKEILHKDLSYAIVGAAMEVHRVLGSGFPEAIYQAAYEHEFTLRGIPFEAQKVLKVNYKDVELGEFRVDFVVDGKIIVEIKAVSAIHPAHEAQALHYLAASGLRLAIVINFGAQSLESSRIVR